MFIIIIIPIIITILTIYILAGITLFLIIEVDCENMFFAILSEIEYIQLKHLFLYILFLPITITWLLIIICIILFLIPIFLSSYLLNKAMENDNGVKFINKLKRMLNRSIF